MHVDPDLAAVLLAVVLGVVPGVVTGRRVLAERRRAKRFCLACGRLLVRGQRTCDC